jgi:surface polysaccharide O-acyltransferase-like enzyme
MSGEVGTTIVNPAAPEAAGPESVGVPLRRLDVDALRVVAAVMVVTIHLTSALLVNWVSLVMNMASRCAVPTFFALSGWALLARRGQSDEMSWFVRRLQRLIVPLLAWNIVFVGSAWVVAQVHGWELATNGHAPIRWLLREAMVALVGPGTGAHLWFLYYLVPVTVVVWMIQVAPRAVSDGRIRLAFGCAAAALVLPFGLAGSFFSSVSWVPYGWALGYAVLGYVVISAAPPRTWISAVLYLGATAALVVTEQLIGYDHWQMSYAGPLVFVQTLGLIGLVRTAHIPERRRGFIAAAAKLTFGVYLVHLLFVQGFYLTLFTWRIPEVLMLLISLPITVVASFAVVACWHRVPGLEKLLG